MVLDDSFNSNCSNFINSMSYLELDSESDNENQLSEYGNSNFVTFVNIELEQMKMEVQNVLEKLKSAFSKILPKSMENSYCKQLSPSVVLGESSSASINNHAGSTSSNGLGVPTSSNGLGVPTSSNGLGVPTSSNGLGVPTSSNGLATPSTSVEVFSEQDSNFSSETQQPTEPNGLHQMQESQVNFVQTYFDAISESIDKIHELVNILTSLHKPEQENSDSSSANSQSVTALSSAVPANIPQTGNIPLGEPIVEEVSETLDIKKCSFSSDINSLRDIIETETSNLLSCSSDTGSLTSNNFKEGDSKSKDEHFPFEDQQETAFSDVNACYYEDNTD